MSLKNKLIGLGLYVALLAVGMPSKEVYASTGVKAVVDISAQKMQVFVDGRHQHTWKVSTARDGYTTPTGNFKPNWLKAMHYSRKYDNSPMPYSVFFHGGYAVHGTNYVSRLGTPASHGCIRLHTDNAKMLFELVKKHGKSNSNIVIVESSWGSSTDHDADPFKIF